MPEFCDWPATTEVSIIIPAHNEAHRLQETVAAIRETVSIPHEIVVVNDGSTDGCCDFLGSQAIHLPRRQGVAQARNIGASHAKSPILVTLDGHCTPRAGWLELLLDQLHRPGAGIVAPQIRSVEDHSATTFGLTVRDRELGVGWLSRQSDEPYAIPLAGAACMVMKREFFEKIGRFDAFRSYGMEDVEICIRCWLLGYSVMMVPGAVIDHWFKKVPFAVNWHDYLYNRMRTAVLHFDGPRLGRILAALQAKPNFADAAASLLSSDIWSRHQMVRSARKYDADWFCQKFGVEL
jgi:GT2 family glycosyltransferase